MQKRRRKARVRVAATSERPRLSVFRSLKEIYAQIIDNGKGATLVSVSTKEIKDKKNKTESAQDAGKLLAEKAIAKGIKKVVFDRSSYQYHGRVKALADGAREGGLEF
ncbi:MAG: 50S ribosomal protein L18 [Patescibacteria group bacterium]